MAIYAKVDNGVVTEYPLFEGDLQRRLPQYAYPLDSNRASNGFSAPPGYAEVIDTDQTFDTDNYRYEETTPTIAGDRICRRHYNEIPFTQEERDHVTYLVSNREREKRNEILRKTDIYAFADRWQNYTDQEKQSWLIYRQALRDVTLQQGFPYSIQWPVAPSSFTITDI